jgi:hypothetical protein
VCLGQMKLLAYITIKIMCWSVLFLCLISASVMSSNVLEVCYDQNIVCLYAREDYNLEM